MRAFKKYYIYIVELIIGNIIFNTIYSLIKTLTFKKIGATNETFIKNFLSSFKETFIVFIVMFIISVIVQIIYDRLIVKKLNDKLKRTKERGNIL